MESNSRRGTQPVLDSNTEQTSPGTAGLPIVQPAASADNQANNATVSRIGNQDGKPSVDGAGLAATDKPGKLGGTDDIRGSEHTGRISVAPEPATINNMVQGREDANTAVVAAATTDTSGVTREHEFDGLHSKLDKLVDIPDDNLQVDYVPHSKSEALKTRILKYQANSLNFIVMLL